MAASDYTGKEKASLNNIKEMIENGASLQQIRGAMGLGYSLDVLAAANGGTGVNNLQDVADTISDAIADGALSIVNALLADYFPLSTKYGKPSAETYTYKTKKIGSSYYATTNANVKMADVFQAGVKYVDYSFGVGYASEGSVPSNGGYVFQQDGTVDLNIVIPQSTHKLVSVSGGNGRSDDIYCGQGMNPLLIVYAVIAGSLTELGKSKSSFGSSVEVGGSWTQPELNISKTALKVSAGDRIVAVEQLVPVSGNSSYAGIFNIQTTLGIGAKATFEWKKAV